MKSKISDNFFLNFIRNYNFFFFFIGNFCIRGKLSAYFVDFEVIWIAATKSAKFGRPSGGMLNDLKSSLKSDLVNFKKVDGKIVVTVNRNHLIFFFCNTSVFKSQFLVE